MLASLIAERYSKALLRAARAEGAVAELGLQAESLRLALEGAADAADFLGNPLAAAAGKLEVLTGALPEGGHPLLREFLAAVLEHKRESFLPAILKAFGTLCDAAQGRVTGSLGTARALARGERELLESALSRRLARTVRLEPYTDKALLGGAVLTLDGTVFDGSLRGGLNRLGRLLAEGPAAKNAPKTPAKAGKAKAKAPAKTQTTAKTKAGKASAKTPAKAGRKASKKKAAKKAKP